MKRLNIIRIRFFLIVFSLFLIPSFIFGNNSFDSSTAAALDSYLSEIQKAYHVTGMSFAVADKNETLYSNNLGQCSSSDQLFIIGSQSKSFTALGIMQLVEKGLINLDADVSEYLPEYHFKQKVSVQQLLNQNSGFDTYATLSNVKIKDHFGKYQYSNANYALLGKIIERVSGLSYSDYIKQNIFEPLDMNLATADSKSLRHSANLIKGNRIFFGKPIVEDPKIPLKNDWIQVSSGRIAASSKEMTSYLQMYLRGGVSENGKRIISEKSIEKMWFKNISETENGNAYYGMGWNYGNVGGYNIVYHGGKVENYNGFMFIIPEKQIAVSFLLNQFDHFGTASFMKQSILGVLDILDGKEPAEIKYTEWAKKHTKWNNIYLIIFLVAFFALIKSVMYFSNKGVQEFYGKKKYAKLIFVIVIQFAAAVFFIIGIPALAGTPLFVIRDFVPDMFVVMFISSAMFFTGSILCAIRLYSLLLEHYNIPGKKLYFTIANAIC